MNRVATLAQCGEFRNLLIQINGDANRFRLGVEALRLGLAYEYDPYFALSIARIDPLPHQLKAVYHYFVKSPRTDHCLLMTVGGNPGQAGGAGWAGVRLQDDAQRNRAPAGKRRRPDRLRRAAIQSA